MLQKITSREVTRRNLTHAISSLRACSSVDAQDGVNVIAGGAKQELRSVADASQHPLSSRWSSREIKRWLCSHGYLRFCSQCSLSIDSGRYTTCRERSSDHTTALSSSYGSRHFSSAVAEEASDVSSPSANPPSDALQKYLNIIQVCEILETHPWGQETAKHLQDLDVSFTSDMVVRVIRAASSPASSLGFFNWLTLTGFEQDALTYKAMLDVLGEAGSIDDMKYLSEEMRKSALVLVSGMYDRLIHWCVGHGDAVGASSFLEKMKEEGIAMSASTYTSMFDLHVKEGKYEDAVTLYLQMVEESVLPSSETLTLLIRCLLEAGKLESAQRVFASLSTLKIKPPSSMFAYLMAAYAKVGNLAMLQTLGKEMRNSSGRPGDVFCVALNSLHKEGRLEEADAFAKEVWPELSVEERRLKAQEHGIVLSLTGRDENDLQDDFEHLICADSKVRVSLPETARLLATEGLSVFEQVKVNWTVGAVYKLLRQFESCDFAWEFFKWLKSTPGFAHDIRNEVSMLRILVKGTNFPAFKELLSDMQTRRADLSLEIFNILIKDCALVKNCRAAMWVYSRIKESSLQPDEETFTSLVHAFARGRNPDKASDLCFVMQDVGIKPDVETYTAVIHSLGLSGRSDDAWSVYQRMLAVGLKPNVNTYTALLNMMNSVGDTGFAVKIFNEMNDNGVSPTEATQGIMARIWETSGNSAEAQKLETQRKFLSSKRTEDSLHQIYEILLEGLVEQQRSPSLSCVSR
eukprot:c13717_g1_i1 orf=179-2419(+)